MEGAIATALVWFDPPECFRRVPAGKSGAINRALFDLTMDSATSVPADAAGSCRAEIRRRYRKLLKDEEFSDLISRAVDHTKRTKRRFEMWAETIGEVLD